MYQDSFRQNSLMSRLGAPFQCLNICNGSTHQYFTFVDGAPVESHTFIKLVMMTINTNIFPSETQRMEIGRSILRLWDETTVPIHIVEEIDTFENIFDILKSKIKSDIALIEGNDGKEKISNAIILLFQNLRDAPAQVVECLVTDSQRSRREEWEL